MSLTRAQVLAKFNRLYPLHMTGTAGESITPLEARAIFEAVGFSPKLALQMSQVTHGESSFMPGIVQTDPGDGNIGYGLTQVTPHAWGVGSAAYRHMQSLGGITAMRNPIKNAEMAKWLSDHQDPSNPLAPWYGTRYLNRNPGPVHAVLSDATTAVDPMAARKAAISAGISPSVFTKAADAAGLSTDALLPSAQQMSRYLRKYGSYEDALVAFRAGPQAVGRALGPVTKQFVDQVLGAGSASTSTPVGSSAGAGVNTMGITFADAQRRAIVGRLLTNQGQGTANNPLFASGLLSATPPNPADFTAQTKIQQPGQVHTPLITTGHPPKSQGTGPTSPDLPSEKVIVAPGANRAGVGLQPILMHFVTLVADHARHPLTLTTGTNHNQFVFGEPGRQSQHWTGNAGDFAMGGDARTSPAVRQRGDLVAAHALVAAGVHWNQAIKDAQRGGVFNITPTSGQFAGHHIQVLWKTDVGGNHYNHVHIGIA